MNTRNGYSDALILSEGRYEARERHREVPEIEVESNKKSRIVRVSEQVVKRIHSDLKQNNAIKKGAA